MLSVASVAVVAGGILLLGTPSFRGVRPPSLPGPASALGGQPRTYTVSVPGSVLPKGLSPGACQAQRPDAGDRHLTVFIDPGHGGPDPGAVGITTSGSEVREKDVTLGVALEVSRQLRSAGFTVVLARTQDSTVATLGAGDTDSGSLTTSGDRLDTMARVACANAANAAVLVSIHFNSFDDPAVGGAETFYDDARPFTPKSRQLAESVQRSVLDALHGEGWQVPDRGTFADSESGTPALTAQGEAYGHLLELGPAQAGWLDHPSQMPGALTEPLFLSRPSEADLAADPKEQATMATGISRAIEAFLSPPATPSTPG